MWRRIDTKYILIFIVTFVLSLIVANYKEFTLDLIKGFLQLKYLDLCLVISFFTIAFLHKLKYNNYREVGSANFKEFKTIVLDLLSTIMDPATLLCSISLLKGLFLWHFFDIKYFNFFNGTETFFFGIVGIFFLIKSGLELKNMVIELFLKTAEVKKKAQ